MTLVSGDPRGVDRAVALSRATLRTVKQNLFFAFIYNIVGIPLAAGVLYPVAGWLLPPMFAAGRHGGQQCFGGDEQPATARVFARRLMGLTFDASDTDDR